MDNLSSVLRRRRRELGLTLSQIADMMGVAEATVQRWESGKIKSVRHEKINRLAEVLKVSPASLMGWENAGAFFVNKYPEPQITDDVAVLPIIGEVAAGYEHIAAEDWIGDTVEIPVKYLRGRSKSDYIVLTVKGDSMYPIYMEGDKVLILKTPTLSRSGEVGLVRYDGDNATLKKVEYAEGQDWVKLIPINPQYPPLTIKGADLERCEVIGIPQLLIRKIE